MFDTKDIVMPAERFISHRKKSAEKSSAEKEGEDDTVEGDGAVPQGDSEANPAHAAVGHWFVKQWEAMKGYYLARLWKEESLQQLTLEAFTDKIADAVERRWDHYKEKQREAKRKKRQREHDAQQKKDAHAAALAASRVIILTNFITLESFAGMSVMQRAEVWDVVGALILSFGAVEGSNVLIDETPLPPPTSLGARTEDSTQSSPSAGLTALDDRIALRVTFSKSESAAKAVESLNGKVLPLTGRPLLCELIPSEVLAEELQQQIAHEAAVNKPKSFMDIVEESTANSANPAP